MQVASLCKMCITDYRRHNIRDFHDIAHGKYFSLLQTKNKLGIFVDISLSKGNMQHFEQKTKKKIKKKTKTKKKQKKTNKLETWRYEFTLRKHAYSNILKILPPKK